MTQRVGRPDRSQAGVNRALLRQRLNAPLPSAPKGDKGDPGDPAAETWTRDDMAAWVADLQARNPHLDIPRVN